MGKNKIAIQKILFDRDKFRNKRSVLDYLNKKNYKCKNPKKIIKYKFYPSYGYTLKNKTKFVNGSLKEYKKNGVTIIKGKLKK